MGALVVEETAAIRASSSHQPSNDGSLLKNGDAPWGKVGGPIIKGFIKWVGRDGGRDDDEWWWAREGSPEKPDPARPDPPAAIKEGSKAKCLEWWWRGEFDVDDVLDVGILEFEFVESLSRTPLWIEGEEELAGVFGFANVLESWSFRICFFRSKFLQNPLPHIEHWNGFLSLCVCMWKVKL